MSQELLGRAKQGDPQAIAALMNKTLQPKGITARVNLKDDCLRIMLEGEKAPEQRGSVAFVQRGMEGLGVESINKIQVFGRPTGEEFPSWSQEIALNAGSEIQHHEVVHATTKHVEQLEPQEEQVKCPKCRSTQITASKKGFGVGKAAAGAVLLGPLGLAGGMIGSNQLLLSCLKCGHQWEPVKINKPEKLSSHRVTAASLHRPGIMERIGVGIFGFFGLGILGLILLIIPIIGWILGPICLLLAVGTPLAMLTSDSDSLSVLKGKCPYCNSETAVPTKSTRHSCASCKSEIVVEGQKFYALE